MLKNLPALARCLMFEGIAPDELPALLLCLKAREKEYHSGCLGRREGSVVWYLPPAEDY